jgi:hypothetical protein
LIERKHSVDHCSDAPRLEEFTDLGKLLTVWTHEQALRFLALRIILRLSNPNTNTHEKVHVARANAASGGPISETTVLLGFED